MTTSKQKKTQNLVEFLVDSLFLSVVWICNPTTFWPPLYWWEASCYLTVFSLTWESFFYCHSQTCLWFSIILSLFSLEFAEIFGYVYSYFSSNLGHFQLLFVVSAILLFAFPSGTSIIYMLVHWCVLTGFWGSVNFTLFLFYVLDWIIFTDLHSSSSALFCASSNLLLSSSSDLKKILIIVAFNSRISICCVLLKLTSIYLYSLINQSLSHTFL